MNRLRTMPLLMLCTCLSIFIFPETATSAPCVTATAACTEWITLPGEPSRFLVYRTYPLDSKNESIARALIVIHGGSRDADNQLRTGTAAAFLGSALEDTIVIAPRFASNTGNDCRDALASNELNWTCEIQRPDSWRYGGLAIGSEKTTSYDIVDEILRKLGRKEIFPNLNAIVVAGHSGGGAFVTRYEMTNQVHDKLGVSVTYVVSNPNSYAYLDRTRPTSSAYPASVPTPGDIASGAASPEPFVPFFDAANCITYDNWPNGLGNRAGYSSRLTEEVLKKQLATRPTTYLLGEQDILSISLPPASIDRSCSLMAQGPTRLARGLAFGKYVNERFRGQHRTIVLPLCGHNSRCMFTADLALPILFPKQ